MNQHFRERNPRRVVSEMLMRPRDWMKLMVGFWRGTHSTFIPRDAATGKLLWNEQRKALPEEMPENQPEQWERLADYCDAMINRLAEVRDYALARCDEVKAGKRW